MHIRAKTNIGLIRKRNEDFFLISEEHGLVVVCDGMGGHPGGDVASKMAAEEVIRSVTEGRPEGSNPLGVDELEPFAALVSGVFSADQKLRAHGKRHTQYQGMGTTLAALQEHEGMLCVVHVGDSRVYSLEKGRLTQLTQDHSVIATLPESAREDFSGIRNILTRAVGVGEDLEVDFTIAAAKRGETYLLCSDGLHNFVSESRIAEVLSSGADPENCLDQLIEDANDGGGADNITMALAWADGSQKTSEKRLNGAVLGSQSGLRVQIAT